jgi:hypothetical protein
MHEHNVVLFVDMHREGQYYWKRILRMVNRYFQLEKTESSYKICLIDLYKKLTSKNRLTFKAFWKLPCPIKDNSDILISLDIELLDTYNDNINRDLLSSKLVFKCISNFRIL